MLIDQKHTFSINELQSISIDELRDSKQLSVRACNCCSNGKLLTLYDIIQYYQKHNSFLDIRNTGRKTTKELEDYCKIFIPLIEYDVINIETGHNVFISNEEQNSINEDAIKDYIQNNLLNAIEENLIETNDFFKYVNLEHKELLYNRFNSLLPKYSVRTTNRLRNIGYEDFITKYLFKPNDAMLDIRLLGKKSQIEAIDFKEKFKKEVGIIFSMTKKDIEIETFLKDKSEILKDDFVSNFYFENGYLPMFWLLEKQFRLTRDSERNMDIFLSSYQILNDTTTLTLNELGKKYNITRERTRQISSKIFQEKIILKEDISKDTKDWFFYNSHFENEKIVWSDDFIVSELLKKENCNFSTSFAFTIIAELCKETHTQFGNVFTKNNKWLKSLLIHKEFSDIFDFESLYEDFDILISNNDSEFYLDIDKYILQSLSWITFEIEKINGIVSIVKDILLFEFGLYSEENGTIKIPAMVEKKPIDVVYEILKQHNKQMHLNEIFHEFKQILPNHYYQEPNQLRAVIQQNEKISHRSRKSVYTLAEWKHVKSGTIRDCIKEFLSLQETPQSIDKITEYVLQYFPKTNSSSIRTSMLSEPNGQYVYYGNNLFGLKGKKYSSQYVISESNSLTRKTFEKRLYDLEKFIVDHEHFPFSNSNDSEQDSLNRWWNRIIEGKQKMSDIQEKEVNRIKEQYSDYKADITTYLWFQKFQKCRAFLIENNRLPQARGDEQILYRWLSSVKDDFKNNKLTDEQRKKYIELVKLM